MKRIRIQACLLLCMLFLSSCASKPNPQATVDAAVAATIDSKSAFQATLDNSVQSTLAAIPTLTPQPLPTPSLELLSYDEEDLASQAEESVAQTELTLQECYTTTQTAASSGTLTQAEVKSLLADINSIYNDLEQAEALLAAYAQVYGDLSPETLAELDALVAEIGSLLQAVNTLDVIYQQANAALQQGQTLTQLTLDQLQRITQTTIGRADQAQQVFVDYTNRLNQRIAARQQAVLQAQPSEPLGDLDSTIRSGFIYLDAVKAAFVDKKLTRTELDQIAQLGASFSDGARRFGGPVLRSLADQISGPEGITADLAAGRITSAKARLGSFEASLGARP